MNGVCLALNWSFCCWHSRSFELRIGWLLGVWMLFDLLRFAQNHDWLMMPFGVLVPLTVMLVHGAGHLLAARMVGASTERMVLSILVDQTEWFIPQRAWPHVAVGLAGPLANLALWGGTLLIAPHTHGLTNQVFNYLGFAMFWVGILNLLACSPFDGRLFWRGLLWPFVGFRRAALGTIFLGYASAIGLLSWAVAGQSLMLMFCGVASLLATISDHQQWRVGVDAVLGSGPDREPRQRPSFLARWRERRREAAQQREEAEEADEQEILDTLLAKVSAHGLPSLTATERATLQRISKRQKERLATQTR